MDFSLNSGFDDFPRNNYGNRAPDSPRQKKIPSGHIDCQSWMYFFASVMEDISKKLNDEKAIQKYSHIKNRTKLNMINFIDPKDNILKDILLT